LQINKNSFYRFIESERKLLGFAGISTLGLSDVRLRPLRERLAMIYAPENSVGFSSYMQRTLDRRADPSSLFPWAKSLAIISMPFNGIPTNNCFLPEARDEELSGLIAGYAGRVDYHVFLRQKIIIFSEAMKKYLGKDFTCEISVDTKPLAEKSLAAFSGLGSIGLNSCLLCEGEGSGTCLGILALDIELPEMDPVDFAAPCSTCGKCAEQCPTRAITGKPGEFIYRRCRSYLTMEKKGVLEKDEAALLGDWIFGCDICTSLCPGSDIPPPFKADLEWLLFEKDSIVEEVLKDTALEYPGIMLLRRNALAVLENREAPKARELAGKALADIKMEKR